MGAEGTGGGRALPACWGGQGPFPSPWDAASGVAQASGEGWRARCMFSENGCPAPRDGRRGEAGLCSHVALQPVSPVSCQKGSLEGRQGTRGNQ